MVYSKVTSMHSLRLLLDKAKKVSFTQYIWMCYKLKLILIFTVYLLLGVTKV